MNENELDTLISQAASQKELEQLDELVPEASIFQLAWQTLQGRNAWINLIAIAAAVGCALFGVWSVWSFIQTPAAESKTLLSWALSILFCLAAVSMIKLWSWMEIERYSTVREIKRLELQVALLSQELRKTEN